MDPVVPQIKTWSTGYPRLHPPKIFVFETFGSNLGGTLQKAIKISPEKHELREFQHLFHEISD